MIELSPSKAKAVLEICSMWAEGSTPAFRTLTNVNGMFRRRDNIHNVVIFDDRTSRSTDMTSKDVDGAQEENECVAEHDRKQSNGLRQNESR
jgi:hypothetical protein